MNSNLVPETGYPVWVFVGFLSLSREISECYIKSEDGYFLSYTFLFIYHSVIRHCVVWAVDSVFKYTINKNLLFLLGFKS
jgi:hypothetical protein